MQKELKFDHPAFVVTDVGDMLDEYYVTAHKKEAPELGSLTIVIDKETMQLKQWEVLDMQGVKSTVSLLFRPFKNIAIVIAPICAFEISSSATPLIKASISSLLKTSLFLFFRSVFVGRFAGILFERSRKMALRRKTEIRGDIRNGFISI